MQQFVRGLAAHIAPFLKRLGLTPNFLTLAGLVITAGAALLVASGHLLIGGLVLLFGALFDILDGAVARISGPVHRYGAFWDSTVDRYAEAFIYGALLYYFLAGGPDRVLGSMLVMASLTGSLLVSYVRARAQSLNFECDGGLFARPERVVVTVIALVISPLLIWVLWLLAIFTNVTAVQRIWFVWRQARAELALERGAGAQAPTQAQPKAVVSKDGAAATEPGSAPPG